MTTDAATLLLVDDDAMNLDALSRRLTRNGYAVLTAGSGSAALELVRTQRVDAVLLDVMMPGMSGIDTLRCIRQSRSASDLPVIMVTANDTSRDIVEALDLGANDYVTKPVDFAVALARIRTHVTARRADPLTGLANRALFLDRLSVLVARGGAGAHFAVLFLDLDRFKIINDSLGHLAGDELLVSVARRLERSLRSTDVLSRPVTEHTLARFGGDEFTVLLDGVGSEDQARAIAERLLAVASDPFVIQGREVVVSISVGVVMSHSRYAQAEDMLRDADTAMYRAKALGKARCEVFDVSMLAEANRRLQLESGLRHALERDELRICYQPIVALSDGRLTGFEALLRWHHHDGVVPPDQFIPMAEETGLIVPIGLWVMREACRQMCAWDEEFPDRAGLTINVNLSPRQCADPGLLDAVADVLNGTGLTPSRLKLEITEGAVLDSSDRILHTLQALRALGVQLGLDDFGTGYSALNYLPKYPFQTIKIDRWFVSRIRDGGNVEIIRAIVAMAQGLDMDVTAEGVETAEQLAHLKDLSCGFAQGYFFERPLSVAAVQAMLAKGDPGWSVDARPVPTDSSPLH